VQATCLSASGLKPRGWVTSPAAAAVRTPSYVYQTSVWVQNPQDFIPPLLIIRLSVHLTCTLTLPNRLSLPPLMLLPRHQSLGLQHSASSSSSCSRSRSSRASNKQVVVLVPLHPLLEPLALLLWGMLHTYKVGTIA
jgi:hypothetical protein